MNERRFSTTLLPPTVSAKLSAGVHGGHALVTETETHRMAFDEVAGAVQHCSTVHVLGDRNLARALADRLRDVPVFVSRSVEDATDAAQRWQADHFDGLDGAINAEDVWIAYGSGAPS